ncbi:glycosyltransferase [Flavobacteriaceae bacterium]|nr:glycosyltransferase [Flavobacteriaceae bacterium]
MPQTILLSIAVNSIKKYFKILVSTTPKITVLMSVYNGAKFLDEAIDSILSQTFTDFEFIIIDDASSDTSLQVINSYKDARIIVLQNTKNLGLTKSLNIGIAEAKGKYIARMDADDISMPKRLEKQFDFMEEHPEFAFCGSKAISINEEGQEVKYLPDTVCDKDIILAYIFFKNMFTHSTLFIEKKVLTDVGGYDEEFTRSQDYRLYLKLFTNNYFGTNLNEYTLLYRVTKKGVTRVFSESQDFFARLAIKKTLKEAFDIDLNIADVEKMRNTLVIHKKENMLGFFKLLTLKKEIIKAYVKHFSKHPIAIKLLKEIFYKSLKIKLKFFPTILLKRLL